MAKGFVIIREVNIGTFDVPCVWGARLQGDYETYDDAKIALLALIDEQPRKYLRSELRIKEATE